VKQRRPAAKKPRRRRASSLGKDDRLRALRELLYGGGAHASTLASVDLPFDLAGRRTPPFPHSVAQIVSHISYWIEYELERIAGRRPAYPEHAAESWPAVPAPASPAAWQAELTRFQAALERLAALSRSRPATLKRPIDVTHASYAKTARSLESVLWQTLVHNAYHLGQVVLLRQALGAWPPQTGADTW